MPEEIDIIKNNFFSSIKSFDKEDILNQIYAEFGMLSIYENFYLGFANMIGNRYGWDMNIIEIGSGTFPIFSKYIDLKQREIGRGTITAYDPYLITKPIGNIRLCREEFSEESDVSKSDLLVGIMPCIATEIILKSAIKNKKEFFLAFCECEPYENEFYIEENGKLISSYDVWVQEMLTLAQEQEKDGFEVKKEYIKEFYYRYPIISSKRI